MRHAAISALVSLALCGQSFAIEDLAVCTKLRSSGARGLYVAYPNFSPGALKLGQAGSCEGSTDFCVAKAGRNPFDDNARFYYVAAPIPRSEEGVWHIRTQTLARNLDGADQAYLARPAVTTRCSPTQPLEGFPGGGGYVATNDYIDHHAGNGRFDRQIGRLFHFSIQDQPGSQCIATDDPRFGNLNSIYGFEGVERRQKRISRLFSFSGTANAATAYAGLSSEFAYHDRPETPCFGFAAPRPTRSEYLGASIDWKPYLTTIWIKRLRGREVTAVGGASQSVSWTP